jgi:Asp-tRNA(Asn)/Glu-tRNA(Gln) amidotransferase A subunit family amidase
MTGTRIDRRDFMGVCAAFGVGGTLFPGVLWARLETQPEITIETVRAAEQLAGLAFTDEQREALLRGLTANVRAWTELRELSLPNSVPPAVQFDPVLPGMTLPTGAGVARTTRPEGVRRPASFGDVAFWPVTHLAELIRTRQATPTELTTLYLDRLARHGPRLEAVVTLTSDRALRHAAEADAEIAAGRYRGPLHGIPWGAKDLLATRGYPTTWGAQPYAGQVIDEDATVVRRLDEAGAILVAKLTLGALAQGDRWFGGMTRNPWLPEQGSSGSSAGPGAATAAGLVGFAIGSETLGSIVSPSARNGNTGLRPTFGRVSRHGAMALSWSMDKIGPMCRSVEDCALVLAAIHGPDGHDPTIREVPFDWDAARSVRTLRVGYLKSAFDADESEADRARKPFDDAALAVVRRVAGELVPIELPTDFPWAALRTILSAESAAAFDDVTRSGRVDLVERSSWPATFRQARFIPAVEYIQANRARTLLMHAVHEAIRDVDVFVTPSFGGNVLLTTNLTGHPAVVLPNGFREDGTPVSITFVGRLFGEAELLTAAKAYQDATGWHLRHPPLFS